MESSAQGTGATGPQPTQEMPRVEAPGESSAVDADAFAERPELFVGAAFAGGIVLAQILKRFGR